MILRRAQANGAAACAFALAAASPYVRERIAANDEMPGMAMEHVRVSPLAWCIAALAVAAAVALVAFVKRRGGLARVSPLAVGLVGAALVAGALAGFDLCGCGVTDGTLFGFTGCHCWLTGAFGALAGLVALLAAREARALVRACAAYLAELVATLAALLVAPAHVCVVAYAAAPLRVPSPHVRRSKGRAPPSSIA
jgi:hypothetical protein